MCSSVIPVGGEDDFFPIEGKHRESIEDRIKSDLLKPCPIKVDHEKVKLVSSF